MLIKLQGGIFPFITYCDDHGNFYDYDKSRFPQELSYSQANITDLPIQAVLAYYKYWSARRTWKCSIVQKGDTMGLLASCRYPVPADDTEQTTAVYRTARTMASRLNKILSRRYLGPEVYLWSAGNGINWHKTGVFVPTNRPFVISEGFVFEILYILEVLAKGGEVPECIWEDSAFQSFLQENNRFRLCHSPSPAIFSKIETLTFCGEKFEKGGEGITIQAYTNSTDHDAYARQQELSRIVSMLNARASEDGTVLNPNDVVTLACNMVYGAGNWTYIQPAMRICM